MDNFASLLASLPENLVSSGSNVMPLSSPCPLTESIGTVGLLYEPALKLH